MFVKKMGLIREPKNVDFSVQSKPWTEEELRDFRKLMAELKAKKISTMANVKKMDVHDFVFVNKPLTAKEEKEFSDFLKDRKSRVKAKHQLRVHKK